jgi:RimJ/RimL family protein N-acetyltransferase
MLLDNKHEIEFKKGYLEEIVAHIPAPDNLVGKTLFVNWKEEKSFDAIAGMMWPAVVGLALAKLYQAKGYAVEAFGATLKFVGDDNDGGVLLTFEKAA